MPETARWTVLLSSGEEISVTAPRALVSSMGVLLFRTDAPDKKGETGQLIMAFAHEDWRRCQMLNDPYGNPILPPGRPS